MNIVKLMVIKKKRSILVIRMEIMAELLVMKITSSLGYIDQQKFVLKIA
jgi:hypothetical protein